MNFFCERCGKCCRNIWRTGLLKKFENERGECIHLTSDNLCDIYDHRPDVCNVEKMYDMYYKDIMNADEYIDLNKKMCHSINTDHSVL